MTIVIIFEWHSDNASTTQCLVKQNYLYVHKVYVFQARLVQIIA